MLRNALHAVRSLLFPTVCMACGEHVTPAMHSICTRCRNDIPLTYYWAEHDNPVKEHLGNMAPIVEASAFFFFKGNSIWRRLIHRFKYESRWRIAYDLGRWYGAELAASGLYDTIDAIVPIPLHPIKQLRRGYNQSHYIAEGMARELHIAVDNRALRRHKNNPSQTYLRRSERWKNAEGIFKVRDAERLRGRHILLVDDMLTSGATLHSAISTIIAAVPDCRISVAVLAVTHHITQID